MKNFINWVKRFLAKTFGKNAAKNSVNKLAGLYIDDAKVRQIASNIVGDALNDSLARHIANTCSVGFDSKCGDSIRFNIGPSISINECTDNKIEWQEVGNIKTVAMSKRFDIALILEQILDDSGINWSLLEPVVDEIANRVRVEIDKEILGNNGIKCGHTIVTDMRIDNFIDALADAHEELEWQRGFTDFPPFAVIHPRCVKMLRKTLKQCNHAGFEHKSDTNYVGRVGSIAGLDIFQSHLIPGDGTKDNPFGNIVGIRKATAVAIGCERFDILPYLMNSFGSGVRARFAIGVETFDAALAVRVNTITKD